VSGTKNLKDLPKKCLEEAIQDMNDEIKKKKMNELMYLLTLLSTDRSEIKKTIKLSL